MRWPSVHNGRPIPALKSKQPLSCKPAMTQPDVIRQSDLHNRLVIDLETTEELGKLAHFLVDVKNHQVEGFLCRKGLLGLDRTPILWVQVESIGQDSILVRRSGNTITERFDEAFALDKQAIWADSGDSVGQLADYCINSQTGVIVAYLFTAPGWQGLTEGLYSFDPTAVVSIGQKRMMVQQTALQNAAQFAPGVTDRVAGAWQQDVTRTRQDLQGAVDSTRAAAEGVQNRAQEVTSQARSQFNQALEEAKRRSRQLRSQVNDRVADVAANLQDQQPQAPDAIPGTTIDVESESVWPDDAEPDSPPSSNQP